MNSKNKGNSFERKIANRLSVRFELITGIKQSFRRNPDSGSFFGGTNQKRTITHNIEKASFGDIICPGNFVYNIECKHYSKSPSFSSILSQNVKQLDDWIKQAEQDSKNINKKLAIIIKYNNVEEFVLVDELISNKGHITYKNYFLITLTHFLDLPDNIFFKEID